MVLTPEFSKVPIKWALLPRIRAQISVRRHLDSVGVGEGTPFFTLTAICFAAKQGMVLGVLNLRRVYNSTAIQLAS